MFSGNAIGSNVLSDRQKRKEEARQRQQRAKKRAEDIKSGNCQAQGYFDRRGIFRRTARPKEHHPQSELEQVVQLDSTDIKKGDHCFVIDISWLRQWLAFTHKLTAPPPVEITNEVLLEDIESKRAINDFRVVNEEVWNFYHQSYGGGPCITFQVPAELPGSVADWIRELDLSTIEYYVDGEAQGTISTESKGENASKVSFDKDSTQDIKENHDYHM